MTAHATRAALTCVDSGDGVFGLSFFFSQTAADLKVDGCDVGFPVCGHSGASTGVASVRRPAKMARLV